MKISCALEQCAAQAGLRDVDIAAAVGVSESTVNKWRRGISNPRHELYLKLLKLLPDLKKMVEAAA